MHIFDQGMGKYNGMPIKKTVDVKRKLFDKIKKFKDDKFEFLESVDDPDAEDEEYVETLEAH